MYNHPFEAKIKRFRVAACCSHCRLYHHIKHAIPRFPHANVWFRDVMYTYLAEQPGPDSPLSPPSSASKSTPPQFSHTPVSYYFPRCHPLSPPRTPHVTPPTPVGPGTPPAARKQVSHRRFRLWSAPNPASAPRCSPLLVAPPQYTLNPRSAVGRDPRRPPMPGLLAVSFSEPCAFGLLFSAFPRLGKLDFPLMHRRFPQPACVASAPRAFRVSAASIPHAPNKPAKALAKARSRHHSGV
ncbi:hypothetical protein PGT21_021661 [Puccinia graminis f. sp. tritici]|uniref:Uncharacterized protein n=1 Tax=Puccinia graminis f. sp. tritici TaxID=56615 RepID=A0A5B0NGX7_PUCGR|nr:hypothetical protein PGT21_021661 [Puccinia graminis f. sp. tritici]